MYHRPQYQIIKNRIEEPRKFIQVIMGPRQVGKTTVIRQVLNDLNHPYAFFSADNIPVSQKAWLSECWEAARMKMKSQCLNDIVLIIDEVQKIAEWSEAVKKEWDYDSWHGLNIKLILLGSSRVMLEKGLADSLMGRYEEIRMGHWSFNELSDAFGISLEDYIYYGSYPGAATLIKDPERWQAYISGAIVDATINKDILIDSPVGKPTLLRQTFELGASYSGEILSLTKMVGALQDTGNTTTISGYLNLLKDSGLIAGLQKYANDEARKRASIPKLQVFNNALKTITLPYSRKTVRSSPMIWGRVFESAIGAHIINYGFTSRYETGYWRDGKYEVDFVIKYKDRIAGIEVKSNNKSTTGGLEEFRRRFNPYRTLVVGDGGLMPVDFLSMNPLELLT